MGFRSKTRRGEWSGWEARHGRYSREVAVEATGAGEIQLGGQGRQIL
jgi:hypothetical protein